MQASAKLLALLILLSFAYPCSGAVVHGVVYNWENLKPLPKAVIVVNTTPEQKYVTPDGHYSFSLPPGHYVIRAYYYQNGRVVLYAEDNVTIEKNGSYIVDLILFPPLNFNFTQPNVEFPSPQTVQSQPNNRINVAAVVAVCFVAIVSLAILRKFGKLDFGNKSSKDIYSGDSEGEVKETESVPDVLSETDELRAEDVKNAIVCLPDDLREALDVIVSAGGRITQKELRSRLKYSEAKVSLILTDLERRGYIEKVKKGRGNVIFLKDKYRKFFGL